LSRCAAEGAHTEIQAIKVTVLIGLRLNSLFGWPWADPVAVLVIAAIAVKEGRDAWRGDARGSIPHRDEPSGHLDHTDEACGCGTGCDCCSAPASGPEHQHVVAAVPWALINPGWVSWLGRESAFELPVPCPPELTELFYWHMNTFPPSDDGRIFRGERGGPVSKVTYA
jgi:hypothetical protein